MSSWLMRRVGTLGWVEEMVNLLVGEEVLSR